MHQTALLDQVVVTGTAGATQRRAVGNVIESIKATDILTVAPVTTVDQLVEGRTPGLVVLPSSGQVGTGSQLARARCEQSFADQRATDLHRWRAHGRRTPVAVRHNVVASGTSALDDINPEDIESIEVIKGPAAGTLYGTEASNGVIQIITKRGRSGKASWNFSQRQGTNWLANPAGRAGTLYSKDPTTQQLDSVNCTSTRNSPATGRSFRTACSKAPI